MNASRLLRVSLALSFFFTLTFCTRGVGGPGNALHFGRSGSVSVPHNPALNAYPFTVTAWIQSSEIFQAGIVTKAATSGAEGWQLSLSDGMLNAIYQTSNGSAGNSGSPLSATGVTDGLWHHIAFTVDATGGHLYVDGVQKGSRAWTGTPGAPTITTSVTLGNFANGGNSTGYDGLLDEVTIWNVALTQSQIQSSMNRTLTGNESGLVAYYRCDENSGFTLNDSASAGGMNNGTWYGNVFAIQSGVQPFTAFAETLPATGTNEVLSAFNGVANPEGTNAVAWFQWGTTTNYGNTTLSQPMGNGSANVNFTQPMPNLYEGLYYFRAVVSNALGVAFGTNQVLQRPAFYDAGFDLTNTSDGTAEWGDYDNDGLLDILLVGFTTNGTIAQIWRNTGTTFSNIDAGLAITNAIGHWVDYDNDGRLDVLLSGQPLSGIWRNTGDGFSNVLTLPRIHYNSASSTATLGDYDNDGRTDVIIADYDTIEDNTQLWRNSAGAFYRPNQTPLPLFMNQSPSLWIDYNNDGRLDVQFDVQLLQNVSEGNDGVFTQVTVPWTNQFAKAIAWGDFNNDGLLDLLMSSSSNDPDFPAGVRIWQNTGSGFVLFDTFTEVAADSVAWGDYDSDGKLDFVITGDRTDIYNQREAQLWRNTGSGFSKVNSVLPGIHRSAVAWGDYDNDGRLDLIFSGVTNSLNASITRVFRNNTIPSNTRPTAPTGLKFTALGNKVGFAWNAATDAQTPSAGLTYNLRVGTAPGAGDVMTANAASNGKRRLSGPGNVQHNLFFPLRNLPMNQPLYASVQAVDTSFAGSPFSLEKSFAFTIEVTPPTGAIPGDSNGDGIVTQAELDAVLANYWPYSPWLSITNVAGLGGTNVTFALSNSTAGAFSVEYTTNFADWFFLGPATPRYEFTDTNAPAEPQRYYRLRWP